MTKFNHFIAVICLVFTANVLSAQTPNTGKMSFSAGVGISPTFIAEQSTVNTPPVNVRLTYQFSPAFSLSGYAGYSSSTSTSPIVISDGQRTLINNKQTLFGLRGEIKKSISKKFDVYGGALVGYNHSNINEFDEVTGATFQRDPNDPSSVNPDPANGEFLYSGFIGSTYYVYKGIGLFAEIGYGVSLLNAGITIKI